MTAMISVRGLVKRYGTTVAADGVTFEAARGECFGLLGPNGAGKSTTIGAIVVGGMFPLFLMPPWMQTASNVSPVKWGIFALEGGIWRGFTLADLAAPCGVLIAIGVAGFVGGSLVLARRDW